MPFAIASKASLMKALSQGGPSPSATQHVPKAQAGRAWLGPGAVTLTEHSTVHGIIQHELQQLSSVLAVQSVPGRGRGLYAAKTVAAGEVVFEDRAFAWVQDPLGASNDTQLLQRVVPAPHVGLQGMITRFAGLHPNYELLEAVSGDSSATSETAVETAAQQAAGASQPMPTVSMVCPAIHRNGFQTRLPTYPGDTTSIADGASGAADQAGSVGPLPQPGHELQLMCLIAALTNHSCDPSMRYEACWLPVSGTGSASSPTSAPAVAIPEGPPAAFVPGLRFVAVRDIQSGDELTHPYVDPSAAAEDRQARLEAGYGFRCSCGRCQEGS